MKKTARAARKFGVDVVTGFTGSSIWHLDLPLPAGQRRGYQEGLRSLRRNVGTDPRRLQGGDVKFALEVHPGEIAFDLYSAERALEAVGHHPAFGFNFDPSHLIWQQVDPVSLSTASPTGSFTSTPRTPRSPWTGGPASSALICRSATIAAAGTSARSGRGDVDFDAIIQALNQIGYNGPLSVEWEDNRMDREHGAAEAVPVPARHRLPASGNRQLRRRVQEVRALSPR